MVPLALALMLVATAPPARRAPAPVLAAPAYLVALRDDAAIRGLDLGVEARCLGTAKDPLGGRLRASHAADRLLAPASGAKLLSTAAALHRLGPTKRWVTTVHGDVAPDTGVVAGDLVLVAAGDPDLQPEGLAQLASAIQAAGVREVRGRLVLDLSHFSGGSEPPAFDRKVTDAAYHPHVPAFAVAHGAVRVTVRPGKIVGAKVRVGATLVVPSITLDVDATTVAGKDTDQLTLEAREAAGKTVLVVRGTIGLKAPAQVFKKRVADPARVASDVFVAQLKKAGLRMRDGAVRVLTDAPAKLPPELARLESKPLAELVRETNTSSNNFMAELIFRHLGADDPARTARGAGSDWTRAQDVATAVLVELGLAPADVHIENGSGLFPATRVTPRGMVVLLATMAAAGPVGDALRDSLAKAGESGTLKTRLVALKGRLRAKTGTLDDAISLSGYLDAPSCTLAFAVFVNGDIGEIALKNAKPTPRAPSVVAAIDRFVTALSKL